MEIKPPKIEKLTCRRCNYEWTPRMEKLPKSCPNRFCHSPYWKTKRKKSNKVVGSFLGDGKFLIKKVLK